MVRDLFDYKDGRLYWKVKRGRHAPIGSEVARNYKSDYKRVWVYGKIYTVHYLVWLWHNDCHPVGDIDHRDRIIRNNDIDNLRVVSRSFNIRNSKLSRLNSSGIKGIYKTKDGRWMARIKHNYKYIFLGRHDCLTEAAAHRYAAEQCLNWYDYSSTAYQHIQQYIRENQK